MKVKTPLHYNVPLDICSTKLSFITFSFTVFVNIIMNSRMIASD